MLEGIQGSDGNTSHTINQIHTFVRLEPLTAQAKGTL